MDDNQIMPGTELWKVVTGSEDYEVSNLGRVRHSRTGRMKIPTSTTNGLVINLYANKRTNVRKLHSIVADAFLRFRQSNEMVWHKDGDQANCAAENLAYIALSDHFRRLSVEDDKTSYGCGKLTRSQAAQIRSRALNGEPVHHLAAEYGVSSPLVSNIKLGRKWRELNFKPGNSSTTD
jgi:hypothetical protein